MPPVKLDDHFPDHPKIVSVGPLAAWLQVCALAYCARHLTDGFLPRSVVSRLADFSDITLSEQPVQVSDLVATLVREGIWEAVDGGYRLHDYLDYNPSRTEVLRQKDQNRERQSSFRQKRNAVTNGVTQEEQRLFLIGETGEAKPRFMLSEPEKKALLALKSVENYPFNWKDDYALIKRLVDQFGEGVVYPTINAWVTAKTTDKITKRHKPRLQLHNWCEFRFKNKDRWNVAAKQPTATVTKWNGQYRNGARPKVSDEDEFERDAAWLARAREGGL